MTAVGRSRLNKNEIWWRKAMGTFKDGCLEPTRLLHDDVPAKDMQVQKAMQKYRNAVQNAQLREGPNAYLKFWAPGQLIFLRPLKAKGGITSSDVPGGGDVERGSSVDGIGRSESPRAGVAKTASSVESSRRVYHATWVTFDQVEAEGLLLSSHAPDDHNLVNVCAAIRDCYCSSSSASTSRLPN